MSTMNDPQVFRRRRVERMIRQAVGRRIAAGADPADPDALAAEVMPGVVGLVERDPGLLEAMVLAGLQDEIVEILKEAGAVEVAPGVWERPKPPGSAA